MHFATPGPPPEHLAFVPKEYPKHTSHDRQSHIRHDWVDIPIFDDPRGDKLAEPVAPNILVDCDGHKDGAGDRLVRVHGVRRCNRGKSCDLNAQARVANSHDDLPGPGVLVADGGDDVSDDQDQHVRDHCGKAHLGFSDAACLFGQMHRYPVGKWAGREQAYEGTNEDCPVVEACVRG